MSADEIAKRDHPAHPWREASWHSQSHRNIIRRTIESTMRLPAARSLASRCISRRSTLRARQCCAAARRNLAVLVTVSEHRLRSSCICICSLSSRLAMCDTSRDLTSDHRRDSCTQNRVYYASTAAPSGTLLITPHCGAMVLRLTLTSR